MDTEHIVGSVCGQKLCLEQATIAADTIDYLTARFLFSEDWTGAEKFAFLPSPDRRTSRRKSR